MSQCVRAVRLRIRTNRKGIVLLPDLLLHSDLEIRYAAAPVGDLVGGGGCFVRVKVVQDVCWGFYKRLLLHNRSLMFGVLESGNPAINTLR